MLEHTDDPHNPSPAGVSPAQRLMPPLLVIDDDAVHRMIICRIAAKAGFAPAGAASYEEALTMLHDNDYAAITLDLSLGQHGGVEILHYVFARGSVVPIIIISGSDQAVREETVGLAGRLHLNVYRSLAKPVDLAHLREILKELCKRIVVGLMPAHSHDAA